MAGTWASYQGHPCASVRFLRGRGMASSATQVVIPVQSFPSDFDWKAAAEELKRRPTTDLPAGIEGGLGDTPKPGVLQLASGLAYEGTLVLAENASQVLPIPGLVVLRIEVDQVDDTGGPAFVRLTLADERVFSAFGILDRWRWNERLPDGALSLDTVKEGGEGFTLEDVARQVVGGMWRKPSLNRVPSEWSSLERSVLLDSFPTASSSFQALATLGQAEDPCFHLDGEWAVYRQGEGVVGFAPDGQGENRLPFPPGVILDEDGAGLGHAEEANWPAEWIVVVGLERVATVALDQWEPVVMWEGRPFLLSEELVRFFSGGKIEQQSDPDRPGATITKVTGGRYGLDWLRKWIMGPNAQRGAQGVDTDVLKLLSEQAWRLYRLPGAEKHEGGFYTGEPGRNAHLLPMLERAETTGGRRLAPAVFAASWESKSRQWDTSEEFGALQRARIAQAEVTKAILTRRIADGSIGPNPFNDPTVNRELVGTFDEVGLTLSAMTGDSLLPSGVDSNTLNAAMREYRRIEAVRQDYPGLAQQLEQALAKKIAAQDALGDRDWAATYDAAKQLVEWEREAGKSLGSTAQNFQKEFGDLVKNLLQDLGRKQRLKKREADSDKEAGRPRGKLLSYVFQQNNPRTQDGGATVLDAGAGVVKTSGRAGHVEKEDVNDPSLTRFEPRPVRVLFGAVVRPRVDVPPGFQVRTATRSEQAAGVNPDEAAASLLQQFTRALTGDPGFGDYIPAALGDAQSVYVAAFRRLARGKVAQVELSKVPLDQALRVRRPWRELVPLNGLGNREILDAEAEKLAIGLASPQDRVKSATYVLAGPWPVQCNGVVSAVEIRSENVNGAICGFTTTVTIGGEATVPADTGTEANRRIPTYMRGKS